MVILYEVHDIGRFGSVQQFVSYCRLVKCAHESAGKKTAGHGHKIGNAHLKWAFSEVDLPKFCMRWVKSGTDGLTRDRFLRIRPQAWGIGGGGIFRRAQSAR